MMVASSPGSHLHGHVDVVTPILVAGWVRDRTDPAWRLELRLVQQGQVLAVTQADMPRPDLKEAGIGDGGYGFQFHAAAPDQPWPPGPAAIRDALTGAVIPEGTVIIPGEAMAEAAPSPPAPAAAAAPLQGHVDLVSPRMIAGWVRDPADPDARLELHLIQDGRLVGAAIADEPRPDLLDAGIGDGHYGFTIHDGPPERLWKPGAATIQHARTGAVIPGGSIMLPADLGAEPVFEWPAPRELPAATDLEPAMPPAAASAEAQAPQIPDPTPAEAAAAGGASEANTAPPEPAAAPDTAEAPQALPEAPPPASTAPLEPIAADPPAPDEPSQPPPPVPAQPGEAAAAPAYPPAIPPADPQPGLAEPEPPPPPAIPEAALRSLLPAESALRVFAIELALQADDAPAQPPAPGAFSPADATAYFAMVRRYRPRLVVEFGTGTGTPFALAALAANGQGRLLQVADAAPALPGAGHGAEPADAPAHELTGKWAASRLATGDMLVLNPGLDAATALDIAQRLLPACPVGVYVHLHGLPVLSGRFRPGRQGITDHGLLNCVIGNPRVSVLFATEWHALHNPAGLDALMRGRPAGGGGSLWLHYRPAR